MITDDERRMLEIESKWWRNPGTKADFVRAELGMTETRYYQRLNGLISRNEALEAYPVVVKRLRRIRDTKARTRRARPGLAS